MSPGERRRTGDKADLVGESSQFRKGDIGRQSPHHPPGRIWMPQFVHNPIPSPLADFRPPVSETQILTWHLKHSK